MGFGWQGEKVRLVPLDRERHLANAVRWMNDPEITRWTVVGDWPITPGAEEEFFQKSDALDRNDLHFAIEMLEGEHIGFCGLMKIDWISRVAVTGTLIGRSDLWGRGFGADAARVRARYAFEVLGLRMLITDVMADNTRSLRMLSNAGYEEVGCIPGRYWKRGAFRDQVILVLEAPEGQER
jgi:RimJ/RimL family protein N-acetyltransferase